ncbi:hypothetical protein [Fusobacterium ulcerans]|uniref:hypothetical protein n=1 Tax=Fusobacterium ulcerans TaxID=861 RepID=UPI0030A679EF
MKYNGFTNAGSMYQAKCKANELPIKFVKVKIGNGLLEETEDPAKFIDVKSLKKEVGISEKTQIQDAVRLTIQMDNDGVTEGYFPREFGIYVEDEGVEVLYWYVNDGNEASYLPTQSTAPVKLKNHFNIIATSLESLVVNWSGKEFWIDKEYLEKELEKKQDMTDSRLLTTAKTIWESINELFTKKANKDDVENNLITVDEGKILDARQGPAIVNKINGLAGGYSGTFPLTTAVKEGIYLLPATNKFYVCVENYSGSSLTAPNANFEELSVFQNRNKLENLFRNFYYYNEKIIDYDTSCFEFTKTSKFNLTVKLKINCTILINAGARVTKGNVTIKKNETIIGISASNPSDSRVQIATNIVCKINDVINIIFSSAYDYQEEIMLGILAFS